MWRARWSRGPDVEMVVPIPVIVAVESKNTFGDAAEDFEQIINYCASGKYDAVVLRIAKQVEESGENFKRVLELASRYGIGVVLGGYSYSPLTGAEKVLVQADLRLSSNPSELIREMRYSSQSLQIPIDKLAVFKNYFRVSSREERRGW